MGLIKLYSRETLITAISAEVSDLAAFLDIPADINMSDDHVFIIANEGDLSLGSFFIRRTTDVVVPTEVFCEVLIDIKAGIPILEAYNKQGYTFNK